MARQQFRRSSHLSPSCDWVFQPHTRGQQVARGTGELAADNATPLQEGAKAQLDTTPN